jgi:AraC family transcriptional regulator of adaptative response / DNA-3-methyladenine glycosylase II
VRAVVGQQVSVPAARSTLGRLVRLASPPIEEGSPLHVRSGSGEPSSERGDVRPFPDAATVAGAPDEAFGMPAARRATLRALATAVAAGDLILDESVDRADAERQLLALPGVGPWTAGYVALRALGDPDVFLPTDLGVRRGARALGLPDQPDALAAHATRWRPWRSYALIRLWRHA